VPRLSRKEALHARSLSETVCPLARDSPAKSSRVGQTPAYACSKRERNKIEALFSELKLRMGLQRVRLRRLWNISEQFYMAATAQNLKRLVRFLAQRESVPIPCST
jgi:IS5 family transposase